MRPTQFDVKFPRPQAQSSTPTDPFLKRESEVSSPPPSSSDSTASPSYGFDGPPEPFPFIHQYLGSESRNLVDAVYETHFQYFLKSFLDLERLKKEEGVDGAVSSPSQGGGGGGGVRRPCLFPRMHCANERHLEGESGKLVIVYLDTSFFQKPCQSGGERIREMFFQHPDAILSLWNAILHRILRDHAGSAVLTRLASQERGDLEGEENDVGMVDGDTRGSNAAATIDVRRVQTRVYNWGRHYSITEVMASASGLFVSIAGLVLRVSDVQTFPEFGEWVCTSCGSIHTVLHERGICNMPRSCEGECAVKGTKKKNRRFSRFGAGYQLPFRPVRRSETITSIDYQAIRIQQKGIRSKNSRRPPRGSASASASASASGSEVTRSSEISTISAPSMPQNITIELWSPDLINQVIPGDHVVVCGWVRKVTMQQVSGRRQARSVEAKRRLVLIEANSIMRQGRDRTRGPLPSGVSSFIECPRLDEPLTERQFRGVQAIRDHPHTLAILVNSIAPGIWGTQLVKMGCALALFGGVRKFSLDGERVAVRGDSHVLLCGDPGQGKSQLLLSIEQIAPRAVYVCSQSGTTARGLTVTVSHSRGSSDFHLEAGALVLADRGVCCIDEFDKLGRNDVKALLEAMEQQTVSISKGGVQCSVPSRCSVIAAANPAGGHYTRAKTVAENIRMLPAMLSRFDLVFVLEDRCDERRDRALAQFVLNFHDNRQSQPNPNRQAWENRNFGRGEVPQTQAAPFKNLMEKLEMKEGMDLLPPQLYRKYLVHAKSVHPVLSPEAKAVIKDYYVFLRKRHHSVHATPITTRQLESMIRLAEARARMELRDVVTESDARDVIEVMNKSFLDLLLNEAGEVDIARTSGRIRGRPEKRLMNALEAKSKSVNRTLTKPEVESVKGSLGLDSQKTELAFRRLREQGLILLQSGNRFKVNFG